MVDIVYEVRRNSQSIAPISVGNIGRISKLKLIGLDQSFLKQVVKLIAIFDIVIIAVK